MKQIYPYIFFVFASVILAFNTVNVSAQSPYFMVLGIAQDGGYPQAGCNKECCRDVLKYNTNGHYVSCIAIIDPSSHQSWLLDITPDFPKQLQMLREHMKDSLHMPSGIFLTHAHIGHYAGLMQLGREVMGVKGMPVYVMPRMKKYLENNGPWSQLVSLNNISLVPIFNVTLVKLNPTISIVPIVVPHRDEYSETVGFSVRTIAADINIGAENSLLYIPDIDKWERWFEDSAASRMEKIFNTYKYVLIDGTFMNADELGKGRMKDVPHPTIRESMQLMGNFSQPLKLKIGFIHLNHTNPFIKSVGNSENKTFIDGFMFPKEGCILK